MIVRANVFPRLQTVKTWVDHSLKSAVSEHPLAFNMWKGPKHLWILHDGTFIIFFDHPVSKWFAKYLPYWILKSWGCLLIHWLLMTSILLGIVRICSSLFKDSYFKNEKPFLNFLFHLGNIRQILNLFEKKMIVIANVFARLQTVKTWVDHSLKSVVSEHPWAVNTLKGPKHLWNLHESTFIIFFDHSDEKLLGNYLPYWT